MFFLLLSDLIISKRFLILKNVSLLDRKTMSIKKMPSISCPEFVQTTLGVYLKSGLHISHELCPQKWFRNIGAIQ